jgi:nicotinate dehydrogenase subunit A
MQEHAIGQQESIRFLQPSLDKECRRSLSKLGERLKIVQTESMEPITLKVNGQVHFVSVDPETPLLYVLQDDLGLRGPRFGCGMAQCGACTVILNDQVIRSCVKPVGTVGAAEIITLEGLGTPEKPHPIQQAFIDEGAAQCGFCLSGVILTAKAVLDVNPTASDQEIRNALGGVLCRCFAHTRMLRAIRNYADAKNHQSVTS